MLVGDYFYCSVQALETVIATTIHNKMKVRACMNSIDEIYDTVLYVNMHPFYKTF